MVKLKSQSIERISIRNVIKKGGMLKTSLQMELTEQCLLRMFYKIVEFYNITSWTASSILVVRILSQPTHRTLLMKKKSSNVIKWMNSFYISSTKFRQILDYFYIHFDNSNPETNFNIIYNRLHYFSNSVFRKRNQYWVFI